MWKGYALKRVNERRTLSETVSTHFQLKPCRINEKPVPKQKYPYNGRTQKSQPRLGKTKSIVITQIYRP